MTFPTHPSEISVSKPFVVEHQKHDLQPSGQFVPGAHLIVTPAIRTSGLLAELPDAEARTLLLLLTFLTPNGHVQASVPEVAQALKTSMDKARKRLLRLEEFVWEEQPVVRGRRADSGLETFALSSALVEEREGLEPGKAQSSVPTYQAAGREAVIAHSRSRYAVPRAEAERQVAAQYGVEPQETGEGEEAKARRALLALGVSRDQVVMLFAEHSLTEIQQQLEWLPRRRAKSPARFLIAAIQGKYDPPQWGNAGSPASEPEEQADSAPALTSLAIPQMLEVKETATSRREEDV